MDLPKTGLVWLRHFNLNVCRGENTANCQQQAWCEPNMASMKNKGSPDVVRSTAAMCSAHGTLVTFCVLPHVTDFNGVTRIQTLTLAFPVCRNSVDILDIFQLRGEKCIRCPWRHRPSTSSRQCAASAAILLVTTWFESPPRDRQHSLRTSAQFGQGASGEPAVDYRSSRQICRGLCGNLGWRWHRDRVN